jgi:hypothetical protein
MTLTNQLMHVHAVADVEVHYRLVQRLGNVLQHPHDFQQGHASSISTFPAMHDVRAPPSSHSRPLE